MSRGLNGSSRLAQEASISSSARQTSEPDIKTPRGAVALALVAGAIVPIDYVLGVPSFVLDLFRYGTTLALIALVRPSETLLRPQQVVAALLIACGFYGLISGITASFHAQIGTGIAGIASAFLGFQLVKRRSIHRPFLGGFLFGSVFSSVDILLQWLGLPFFGTESANGLSFSGFSVTRTAAAPLFAVALVLIMTTFLWKGASSVLLYLTRGFIWVVVFMGLILTAGRGGLMAFTLAAGVWVMRSVRTRLASATVLGIGVLALMYLLRDTFLFMRLASGETGFSGSRAERNIAALKAYLVSPILGPDPLSPAGEAATRAHMPILYFGGQAGLLGIVTMTVSISIITFAVLRALRNFSAYNSHGALIGIIILVVTFLEPTGFFVGLGRISILFIALDACSNMRPDPNQRIVRSWASLRTEGVH